MFFFAGVGVIGKSCEVKAEMRWQDSAEQAQVEVSVPVTSFDSGNSLRDGEKTKVRIFPACWKSQEILFLLNLL